MNGQFFSTLSSKLMRLNLFGVWDGSSNMKHHFGQNMTTSNWCVLLVAMN